MKKPIKKPRRREIIVSFRTSGGEYVRIKKEADKNNVPMSELIRQIVEGYLKK